MDKSTLNRLIELSLQNNEKAFRNIVEEFQAMIYSLTFRLLCNEEEAKDAVQETFIKAWLKLSTYESDKKFSTWLYAIATNLCLDQLKAKKTHNHSVAIDEILNNVMTTECSDQKLLNSELAATIQALTNALSPKQKIVFTLRYLEGLEVDEIIQITNLSANKIKSNLFVARQSIRQKLKDY